LLQALQKLAQRQPGWYQPKESAWVEFEAIQVECQCWEANPWECLGKANLEGKRQSAWELQAQVPPAQWMEGK
jgi:hypothetical protein